MIYNKVASAEWQERAEFSLCHKKLIYLNRKDMQKLIENRLVNRSMNYFIAAFINLMPSTGI